MDLTNLKKFKLNTQSKKEPVAVIKPTKTILKIRSRIFYSIVACSIPVFAFLLTSAYSESKKSAQENKSHHRAAIANPFQAETIDNEFTFTNADDTKLPANLDKHKTGSNNEFAKNEPPKINTEKNLAIPLDQNNPDSNVAANSDSSKDESQAGTVQDLEQLTTVLNVTDADIEVLIKTFSKLTGRNYVVDSAVKGKITIHLPTAIKISEALKVFDSILLLKGFATVPIGENIWKVIIAKDAKQTTIPLSGAVGSTSESLVTEILKSTHVGSEEIQKLVAQFISKDGYSQAISGTNLLILVDAASNIDRIKNLLKEIDIPPVDQDITIIPIKHATANDLADKINSILNNEDSSKAPDASQIAGQLGLSFRRSQSLNANANAQAEQQSANSGASRTSPLKIIPDDRTNSLIVVADEFTTLKIRALAEQLDSEIDKSSGRFWVYRLEHANAEELSEVLSNLISGSGGSASSSNQTGSSISRSTRGGSGGANSGDSQFGLNSGGGNSTGSRNRSTINRDKGSSNAPSLISDSSKVAFEDEITVAADPSTNSLIVNASKADYDKLSQVIGELDVKRRQVLVEATILEVSLNDEEALGVELLGTGATDEAGVISQTNFGGLSQLLTDPKGLTDLTIAAASTGTITLPGGFQIPSQAALITAVSKHANVNVLSAPTILSTDNQEAEIIVGENVPFVTSTSTNQTNLNNTFNQIQRQDVGITLKITPQLGTGDFLTLQIFVEISNVVDGTRGDPNGPTTTVRTTDTVVAVKNKQMIVTGGLIQDSSVEATRGIPFLEDVPVVGMLFRKNSEIARRTNLLVFLTPQIIQDQFDARDQAKLKANKLSEVFEKANTTPNREEILKSPALDEVLESGKQFKIQNNVPFTSNEVLEKPVTNKTNKQNPTSSSNTDGVYEFTVGQEKENTRPRNTEAESLFVVFRSLNGSPNKLETNSDGTIGIAIPKTPENERVFTTGSQYNLSGKNLICLGVYLNQQEAETMHADLLNWNASSMTSRKEFLGAGWSFSDDSRNN